MIELNLYDRQWLMEQGLKHEDIAIVEDYITRYQQKYPKSGDCTACMAAYKRFLGDRHQKELKSKANEIANAKLKQMQKDGLGKDYQNGVWAPFNGKVYHDRAKMVNDAKALGLQEMGSDADIAYEQKKHAQRKQQQKIAAGNQRRMDIRQSLAQTLKSH